MSALDSFDPETSVNFEEIEMQFAVKTVEHLEAYQKLIQSVPPSRIKLTAIDDEIFEDFTKTFPELNLSSKLEKLSEDEMKSVKGKVHWREFIMKYEKKVPDYNFGTILRADATKEYSETNSILVTRIQFFAIEIARNRLGVNDAFYEKAQAQKKAAKSS